LFSSCRIYASLEESLKGNDIGTLHFRIRGLELKNIENGLFGLDRSDPYYEIHRKNFDHTVGVVHWNVVYRSNIVCNHLNPYWEPGDISLENICFCDVNWPIKLVVYDHNRRKESESIGEIETTVAVLCQKLAIRGNADRETAFKLYKATDSNDTTNTTNTKYDHHHHILDAMDSIRGYMVVLCANIIAPNPSSNIVDINIKQSTSSTIAYHNESIEINKQGSVVEM
jgi:Ca2+-dependent lipid-binding protein